MAAPLGIQYVRKNGLDHECWSEILALINSVFINAGFSLAKKKHDPPLDPRYKVITFYKKGERELENRIFLIFAYSEPCLKQPPDLVTIKLFGYGWKDGILQIATEAMAAIERMPIWEKHFLLVYKCLPQANINDPKLDAWERQLTFY